MIIYNLVFIAEQLEYIGIKSFYLMPHDVLYNLFAIAMMPKKNHKESRNLFVRQAKKMKRSDFLDWFNLILSNQNFMFLEVKIIYLFQKQINMLQKIGIQNCILLMEQNICAILMDIKSLIM